MTLFVLVYDRRNQQIIELQSFANTQREEASRAHFEAEQRARNQALEQEVVLFQADSEDDLRQTHGSYFFSTEELLQHTIDALRRNPQVANIRVSAATSVVTYDEQ